MMGKKVRVLIVDDNEDVRDLLQHTLERAGYSVGRARHAESALRKARERHPDVVLLDVMMPGQDGFSLCEQLRALLGEAVRLVFLTARMDEQSEVKGFDVGADDYIIKPIKTDALLRRLHVLLKRPKQVVEDMKPVLLVRGDLRFMPQRLELRDGGVLVSLRKREFELLYFLASSPGVFFSRDKLMAHVWGDDVYVLPRTVDVHIRRIREKIGAHHILTRKKLGYAFFDPHADASF